MDQLCLFASASAPLIQSPLALMVTLTGVTTFFFWLERWTAWKLFEYLPALLFIYAVPMVLSATGIMANDSPLFDWMNIAILPMFIVLMLLDIDILGVMRVIGRGGLVFLMGSAGIVFGAPIAYFCVRNQLDPEAWKTFGLLTGSWIGGTSNLAAVAEGLDVQKDAPGYTLAVVADAAVFSLWIPILIGSKKCAGWFGRLTKVDAEYMRGLEQTSADLDRGKEPFAPRHFVYLLFIGLFCAWAGPALAEYLDGYFRESFEFYQTQVVLSTKSLGVLIFTACGLLLSMTPARKIPGSHEIAIAFVYLYMAMIGAQADPSQLSLGSLWFIFASVLLILIHAGFCILGARILRVDVHITAIASAANVGGIASGTVVAAYHNKKLVPVSILMALLGYAIANAGGFLSAQLCYYLR